jgi:hypothetical protein
LGIPARSNLEITSIYGKFLSFGVSFSAFLLLSTQLVPMKHTGEEEEARSLHYTFFFLKSPDNCSTVHYA